MTTLILNFGSFALMALWGLLRPRRRRRLPALRRRIGNIGFWLFNTTTAAALIFVEPDEIRAPWQLPTWLSLVLGFLLRDLMIYALHRAYHTRWLWPLHALHHSDPDVDWSTAVRHHPLEYMLSATANWVAVLVIGIPAPAIACHALCGFTASVAVHGNVRWPAWLERALQPIVITPDTHMVHHSIDAAEANANFGAVLSLWDRLFGTYRRLSDEPVFGVRELDSCEACRPSKMLLTPLTIASVPASPEKAPLAPRT
jgi:sterol desaturase/sphingolipid hydroxylase (fatty acid hydroxylase superfamily)